MIVSRIKPIYFLAGILLLTALVWAQALSMLYTPDDYQYLHHFAPMHSIADFFKQFVTADPNSQYWRPLASGMAVIDFLNWGWDGRGFHITNFILHLFTTGVVYYAARKVFELGELPSLLAMLLFGIAASHESNILWAAGRTDSFATLFLLVTVISEKISSSKKSLLLVAASLLSFILALASKEIGVAAIPLIFLSARSATFRKRVIRTLPFIIIGILFYLYRSQYTAPVSTVEAISGGGVSSATTLIKNAVYTIGYTIIPLDISQTVDLLQLNTILIVTVATLLCAIAGYGILLLYNNNRLQKYLYPALYVIFTGGLTMIAFERWRVYMLSVGMFILIALVITDLFELTKKSFTRLAIASVVFLFLLFHISRSISAATTWVDASQKINIYKEQLKAILKANPDRPKTILFLNRPAKLGGAPLLQIGVSDFIEQAELEWKNSPLLVTGGIVDTTSINVETATTLWALDPKKEFDGFTITKRADNQFDIECKKDGEVFILPAIRKIQNFAQRDQQYVNGDTLRNQFVEISLLETKPTMATKLSITILDPTALPILFDGEKFIALSR